MAKKRSIKTRELYKEVGLAADPNKKLFKPASGSKMVQKLEKEANRQRKQKFKFGKEMVKEITYYIEKYNDDYDAMARDKRNIYQDSAGQLRAKIKKYLAIEARKTPK